MIELFQPFFEIEELRRSLIACIAIVLSGVPIGVFIMLRRMTLVGDGMSHAILPGAALAMLIIGSAATQWQMALGALFAGLIIAALAGLLQRYTLLKEDASFSGLYLLAMAIGVLMVSSEHDAHSLIDMLFGDALFIDSTMLTMIAVVASVTLLALALLYRGLVVECADPVFLRALGVRGGLYQQAFLVLMVLNLVAAFQAMGTLMALGLMLMPAISARFWASSIDRMMAISLLIALPSALLGLALSYEHELATGPTIIVLIGTCYLVSLLFGTQGGLLRRFMKHKHLEG